MDPGDKLGLWVKSMVPIFPWFSDHRPLVTVLVLPLLSSQILRRVQHGLAVQPESPEPERSQLCNAVTQVSPNPHGDALGIRRKSLGLGIKTGVRIVSCNSQDE